MSRKKRKDPRVRYECPLIWPAGWKRNDARTEAKFTTGFEIAVEQLVREMRLMDVRTFILSSDVDPEDDFERVVPDDPGVVVYFTLEGRMRSVPVDAYTTPQANLKAAADVIAALRVMARHKTVLLDVVMEDEAPAHVSHGWWSTLGVDRNASMETIKRARDELALKHHPDRGGTAEKMRVIQDAYVAAKLERRA